MTDGVLLLPASLGDSVFRGFVHTAENCYEVKVTLPTSKNLVGARVEGDWRLSNLIRGQEDLIQQYLSESQDVSELTGKIRDLLTQLESARPSSHAPAVPLSMCRELAKDIDSLGWSRVQAVDALFRHIKLVTRDKKDREHTLTVSPTPKYPDELPSLSVNTPVEFKPLWDNKTGLCGLMTQFTTWLDSLDPFWTCMEELDAHTCVLEPEQPSRADTHRRILIGTHLSLVLNVNPYRPRTFPEPLQFLGPDNSVQELKAKVSQNRGLWNESNMLVSNLQTLLDTQFPRPSSQEAQDMSEECGICYDYRLNGAVPSVVCPNTHCAKPFHSECFEEWLRGLPRVENRRTVHQAGECPFCGQVITIYKV